MFVHLLLDAAALSNFEFLRPPSQSSWKHRASIVRTRRFMYKTRLQKNCPFRRPPLFSKWLPQIQWSVPLPCGAVSSCFRIQRPKFRRPRQDLWRGRSLQLVRGHCCHFLKARNWMARKAVLLDCLKRFFCNGLWSSTIKVVSIWSCTNRSVWDHCGSSIRASSATVSADIAR